MTDTEDGFEFAADNFDSTNNSCPFCGSNDIAVKTQTEYECFDCGETWAEDNEGDS